MRPSVSPASRPVSRSRRLWAWLALAVVVVAAIGGGLVWHQRSSAPLASAPPARPGPTARTGGDSPTAAPVPSASQPITLAAAPAGCGLNADDDGELIFPSLSRYGYSGATGLGNWDLLNGRALVHHELSVGYGATGNAVVGLHREPSFQHIDQLAVGDNIVVHDRSCATFTYRVTMCAELAPERAGSWLQPTSGHDLTIVTCTPWWVDYNRIIWRAQLVS
ncbi:MAG: hypothetical protein NVSMB29_15050 [Candidatus Dormibacteria bacterium]